MTATSQTNFSSFHPKLAEDVLADALMSNLDQPSGHGTGLGLLILPKGQKMQVLPSPVISKVDSIILQRSYLGVPVTTITSPVVDNTVLKNVLEVIVSSLETNETEWHERDSADSSEEQTEGDTKKKKRSSRGRVSIKVNPKLFFCRQQSPVFFTRTRKFLPPKKPFLAKLKKYFYWPKLKKKAP